jgi:hypothetical protein
MLVQFDVPEEMARQFAAEPGGIARAATEALAVEGVRSGKLTVYQARQLLGITSRYEMDGFLKSHGVLLSDTLEQVLADSETAITRTLSENSADLIGALAGKFEIRGDVLSAGNA